MTVRRFSYEDFEDGQGLRMTAHLEDGRELISTVGWADRKTADAFRERAKRFFEDPENITRMVSVHGQKKRIRRYRTRLGIFYVHVNTGPPTWWFPRLSIKRDRIQGGWLRLAVAVAWRASED